MYTNNHSMSTLFAQLGLANGKQELDSFFNSHRLQQGQQLSQASFLNPAQQAFIKQALADDSDWSEVVDMMDARLRH